ncbi:MCD-domain-containing protein [Rhizoclosmatium globosum]|uniref:MCD-domain-containing protein n=1 Tax=Rhizoclosmatium globosum TaxID=329046 RepID=A0A1Y2C8Y4_9FUNG|nr:MCD-domain-containing protein [Rhizoclosmatium globosum]|eukprot:ORY43324.1 MCD-domain-containing protein [Rhizoclosmatium globosum]
MRVFSSNSIKDNISESLNSETKRVSDRLDKANALPFDKYWEDILRTDKDPDYRFSLDAAPVKSTAEIEAEARRLLDATLRGSKDSDLHQKLSGFQCADFYQKLDMSGRAVFLKVLAKDFGPNHESVLAKSEALKNAKLKKEKSIAKLEQELREALEPLFLSFFTQLYQHPGGMRFIMKMREDLLSVTTKSNQDPHLRHMNDLLKLKMQDWFGISFLDLERITWSSPAEVLEKIIKYEAVHAIPSWEALKQRLLPGRACYAFFHKAMPLEPLAFVHVSFEKGIQRNVQSILNNPPSTRIEDARAAIFYTISSPQKGLSGIDLGNLLIKRVVKEIQSKAPQIHTFTTLSPIPGFRNWLETRMNLEATNRPGPETALLLPHEGETLRGLVPSSDGVENIELLKSLIENDNWIQDESLKKALEPILIRLCSRYILIEKKRSNALDPVANFHIRNGACVYQLDWMGDMSNKGIGQSYGMMINYLYDLPSVEENHILYTQQHTISVIDGDKQFGWVRSLAAGEKGPRIRVLALPLTLTSKL